MTGSGNSGLDLDDHDADKKNFYGLLKKKQGTISEEAKAATDAATSAMAAAPPAAARDEMPELTGPENAADNSHYDHRRTSSWRRRFVSRCSSN